MPIENDYSDMINQLKELKDSLTEEYDASFDILVTSYLILRLGKTKKLFLIIIKVLIKTYFQKL